MTRDANILATLIVASVVGLLVGCHELPEVTIGWSEDGMTSPLPDLGVQPPTPDTAPADSMAPRDAALPSSDVTVDTRSVDVRTPPDVDMAFVADSIAAPDGPKPTGGAKLVYAKTFEQGLGPYRSDYKINHFEHFTDTPFGAPTGCELTKTFVVVDDPDDPSTKALRIRQDRDTCITNENDPGEHQDRLNKHRSQWVPIADKGGEYFLPKNTEIWMGVRWRFNGSPNPPGIDPYLLQARIFGSKAYETPDIRMEQNGKALLVRRAWKDPVEGHQYGPSHFIPIPPNEWMHLVMRVRLSDGTPDGYFQLWLNAKSASDKPLISETGITGTPTDPNWNRDSNAHHSIGWYWGNTSTPYDHIMWMDDLRYAFGPNGFDLVNPVSVQSEPDSSGPRAK